MKKLPKYTQLFHLLADAGDIIRQEKDLKKGSLDEIRRQFKEKSQHNEQSNEKKED